MTSKDVLQKVDEGARRAAKTFLRTSRYGALAALAPKTGAPMASRVSIASDSQGQPVFLISQLSGHFGALESDPRCSVLLGEPGRGDPLAHPRITVFGRAERIPDEDRPLIKHRFLARHPKAELYADFGDFAFWRIVIEGASYNGGFGKAYQMSRDDLITPAIPELEAMEMSAVAHMNEDHLDAIALYAETLAGKPKSNWILASLDPEGLDLVTGDDVARIWFTPPLCTAEDLRPHLVDIAKRARMP